MMDPPTPMKTRSVSVPEGYRPSLQELVNVTAPAALKSGLRFFAVGGTIRDLLEDRPFRGEWDVLVLGPDGGADSLARALAETWQWREPVVFPRYGTFLLNGPAGKVEVSQSGRRTTLAEAGGSLEADAAARDFTLNAIYLEISVTVDPNRARLLDPTGLGLDDLTAGTLRTPRPAAELFEDDPLRIVRAARFASTHGYSIPAPLSRQARALTPLLERVSAERFRDEMNRLITGSRPAAGLQKLAAWGVFSLLMPEVQAMVGFRQDNPYHFPDLFRHTLRVLERTPTDLAIRWAALLHDCGKPYTRVRASRGDTYYGHEAVGAEKARELLKRLKMSRSFIEEVSSLVRLHMVHYQESWSDRAVRRFLYRSGGLTPKLLDLLEADTASLKVRADKLRDIHRLRQRLAEAAEGAPPFVSPLDGAAIMDLLGLEPGPDVGRAKRLLAEAVAEGLVEPGKEEAARFLLSRWRGRPGSPD